MLQREARAFTRPCCWGLLLLPILIGVPGNAATIKDHSRFCVSQNAVWQLQRYAPLIDTRRGTEYVQAVYTGKWLQRVFIKKYDERTELVYEYKFLEDGKLLALHGKVRRWGRWMAEADLFPDEDGTVPVLDLRYRSREDGGVIQAPEDGSMYTKVFSAVPVYRTTANIPCAVLFREAEKRDATQE